MRKFFKYVLIVSGVLFAVVLALLLQTLYLLGETEIRTIDPVTIYIHEGVVFDWQAMLDPPEAYAVIKNIGFEMQEQIAHYMKKNNLKLKEGEQIFDRSQPSFEELVNGEYGSFRFEEMKQ